MPAFSPHGGTRVEVRGRVLVFRSTSHMNAEEVQRLRVDIGGRLGAMAGKPWGVLGVVDKTYLLTSDAEATARVAFAQMVAAGLSAQALAFANPADRPLVEAQVTRIVTPGFPLKFFDSEADAYAWLVETLGP